MTEESRKDNEYLLEQLRRCGLFKCHDCLYALWEDRGLGMEYKCCHPRALPHSAWRDKWDADFGSACDVFEPHAHACENVARRMSETSKAVSNLLDYAWRHTDKTVLLDSPDEHYLNRQTSVIRENGMVRP